MSEIQNIVKLHELIYLLTLESEISEEECSKEFLYKTKQELISNLENMVNQLKEAEDEDSFCDECFDISLHALLSLQSILNKREKFKLGNCTCFKWPFGIIEQDSQCPVCSFIKNNLLE